MDLFTKSCLLLPSTYGILLSSCTGGIRHALRSRKFTPCYQANKTICAMFDSSVRYLYYFHLSEQAQLLELLLVRQVPS